ncbi:hypothetical protein [Enterobacter cloacae]|uniref:hypothetical protein n=1 Tax=Enterobacter cloacae TaxID=550 RepID=UPI0039C6F25E
MDNMRTTALKMELSQVRFLLNSEKERLHYLNDDIKELENKMAEILFNQSIVLSSIEALEDVKAMKEMEQKNKNKNNDGESFDPFLVQQEPKIDEEYFKKFRKNGE